MLSECSIVWTPSPCHLWHIIVKVTFRWSQFCWQYLLVGGYCEDSVGTVWWLQGDGLLIHSVQHVWAAVLFDLPCLCIEKLPCWCLKERKYTSNIQLIVRKHNWLYLPKIQSHLCLPAICWIWNNLIQTLGMAFILSSHYLFSFFSEQFSNMKKWSITWN